MKLIQKRLFKGTREFEITDDAVCVRIKGLVKEEKLTVGLTLLNPEPEITGSTLEFHGRANRGALLSLFLNNPNTDEFNSFVDTLKQSIPGEDDSLASVDTAAPLSPRPEALDWNVYEEPPEFEESDGARENISFEPVNVERLDDDITMLKTYLEENDIKPLLNSLETLKAEPHNEAAYQNAMDAFNDLDITQGAVLTYAPYLKVLLSKSISL